MVSVEGMLMASKRGKTKGTAELFQERPKPAPKPVASGVSADPPEVTRRIREMLISYGLVEREEETARETSRKLFADVYRTAVALGHDTMPAPRLRASSSGQPKGSTSYTDLRSQAGMIEFLLRYPLTGRAHGCPACEPEGHVGDRAKVASILRARWKEIEAKVVATGEPPSCPFARPHGSDGYTSLDAEDWAAIWRRREVERIPDMELTHAEQQEETTVERHTGDWRRVKKVVDEHGIERWEFVAKSSGIEYDPADYDPGEFQ